MDGASRERRAAQPEEIGRLAGLPASSDGDDVTGATSMDGDLAIDPGQGARACAGDWVDVSSRSR